METSGPVQILQELAVADQKAAVNLCQQDSSGDNEVSSYESSSSESDCEVGEIVKSVERGGLNSELSMNVGGLVVDQVVVVLPQSNPNAVVDAVVK